MNLPDTIQFVNGNQIVHRYDAAGNRLATDYYTRKVNVTVPLGDVFSATDSLSNYYVTRDAFHNHIVYEVDTNDMFGIEFVHNPEGYIRYNNMNEHYHFYYIKDHLGNVRETYKIPNADTKECVQRMLYYPSGLPWAASAGASEQPWKYNGKEFVEMHGLDEYDSEARWYYPAICRTTTMDPLAETYYGTSPYAWCGNNPIRNIDPDGRIVIAVDEVAQNRILGTLSYTERGYVNFNKNGQLNIDRLDLCTSTSHNMNALKALTKSEVTYNFLVQDKSSNGQTDMKRAGGVTEMYGAESNPSPDPMLVTIISGDHLVGEDAVRNMAHEAFGHAYMYELKNKNAHDASHHYEVDSNQSYIDDNGEWVLIFIDTNTELQKHINEAITEASKNYKDKL